MTTRLALSATAATLALLAVLAPQTSSAQEAAAVTVEEITVTAQLVSEDVQQVPISETVLSGDRLDVIRSSGGDIRVLSSRVPSLTMESSFGRTFPRPYIRGLGNTDFDLNASQPVSFVYDGVVLENPILKGMPLFDIAQVEALRGPQGTLFGRNTPAGVLMFTSARPTDHFAAYGQVSYGSYSTVNAEGAISGPIVPGGVLSARLSGMWQSRNDYVDNAFTGQDNVAEGYEQYALRLQIAGQLNERWDALLNVHYMHLDGTPRLFRANIIQPGTNDFVPGFDRNTISQDAESRAFQTVEIAGGILTMHYDFGEPVLTSITALEHARTLSRGDIDGGFGAVFAPPSGPGFIPFTAESADGLPHHQQFTQELRLAGDRGQISYLAGAYYFYEDVQIDSFNYDTLGGGALNGYARQQQATRSYAFFGNLTWRPTDQWTLAGGLRYSNDRKDFRADRPLSAPFTPPLASNVVLTANPRSDDISWNVSAVYQATPDVNVYGRIARGYRAPSIQGRLVFGNTLSVADSESLISYEAGIKAYLFERRVRANLSAFYYNVSDLQVTAVGGGANFNRLLNADNAIGYGFEFDLEARPVQGLTLTAGLSYNHTEIDDPLLATAPCGSGCTVLDPAGLLPGTVSIDGNSLPNAPEWIANVTARYGVPVGANGELYIYTDWAYRSHINFFLYESAEYSDDRLLEGGVRLGYVHDGGRWEIAAFGRNINNDLSLEGGIDFNNLTGFVNEPRTWGVEARFRLN